MNIKQDSLTDRLGKVVLNFANLELILSCLVTRLISEDSKIGAIVTAEMSLQNMVKAFDSLTQYRITDLTHLDTVRELIKRINTAEQERNTIIHSAYAVKIENTQQFDRIKLTAKQGKGLKITHEAVDIDNLKRQTNEIIEIIIKLQKLHNTLFEGETLKLA